MRKKFKILLIVLFFIFLIALIYWISPNSEVIKNNSSLTENSAIESPDKESSLVVKPNNKITPVKFNPNTHWKDKQLKLNGKDLIFKFGEGNPPETALTTEEYLPKGEKDGIPYVTPETEANLLNFLSDQDLPAVLDKCENYNRQEMQKLNPNIPVSQLPVLLQPSDFDIENILIIDEKTGRKEINQSIVNQMNEFINLLNNPLSGTEFSDKCAGIAYKDSIERIKNKYYEFTKSYINTGDALPSDTWSKK